MGSECTGFQGGWEPLPRGLQAPALLQVSGAGCPGDKGVHSPVGGAGLWTQLSARLPLPGLGSMLWGHSEKQPLGEVAVPGTDLSSGLSL